MTTSFGECDVCCNGPRQLTRMVAYGIETWACDPCLGREPDVEEGCLCPDAWCPLHGGRELEDRA